MYPKFSKGGQLLREAGIQETRLVISRFSEKSFRRLNCFEDLDQVIDETGLQLLGIIPEDLSVVEAVVHGKPIVNAKNAPAAHVRPGGRPFRRGKCSFAPFS